MRTGTPLHRCHARWKQNLRWGRGRGRVRERGGGGGGGYGGDTLGAEYTVPQDYPLKCCRSASAPIQGGRDLLTFITTDVT